MALPQEGRVVNRLLIALAILAATGGSAKAESLAEIAQFAQSICGDIPEGSLTRTMIQGKVEASALALARVITGSVDVSASRATEIYKGIPFEKLPDSIPTVSMCKSELANTILLRQKKTVPSVCRRSEFGQVGWNRTEKYTDSSGKVDGGYDQNWWCNRVAASFLTSRGIGPEHHWEKIGSSESSNKDWKGHVTYKYHCTISVSWDPIYQEKQDPLCGYHEE
jgi:hypothetical protein